MQMSGIIWFAVAVGIGTMLVVVGVVRAKSSARRLDLGSVSTQWITEHRVGSGDGINR
jgi:hypothetical protein